MQKKLLMVLGLNLLATPAFSQQLTREIVDNMNRMCGTGQTVTGGLETDINLLKRLGVIGVENTKNEREISTIIDSIKDEKTKIDALRAIQTCNLEYLRMQGKRSDQQRECVKTAEKDRKQLQIIQATKSVRCEGGGVKGKSDYKEDTASINAPEGFIFLGQQKSK